MTEHLRQLLHYILVLIVKAERLLRRQKIKIVNPEALDVLDGLPGPMIFAPAHSGKFDIQVLTEVLWRYRWSLLSGDPHDLPGTVEGCWLRLNGVIYVDRDDRLWRRRAKAEMIRHLRRGGNLMIYPEGTWNLSPKLPVLPLFRGVADIAAETRAVIVPFAQEIDDGSRTYYVKIGVPIFPDAAPEELLEQLRSQLAELRWSMVESLPFCKVKCQREALGAGWDRYVRSRLRECAYMDFDLVWKYARKEGWQLDREQIETDIARICPGMGNAFLFNKRLKG